MGKTFIFMGGLALLHHFYFDLLQLKCLFLCDDLYIINLTLKLNKLKRAYFDKLYQEAYQNKLKTVYESYFISSSKHP